MMIVIGMLTPPLADDRLIQQRERNHEHDERDQHPFHRQVALGFGDDVAAALARGGEAAADARDQRVAQREQRPHAADQHRADAEVADLRRPDHAGDRRGVLARDARGERGIGVEEERVVDRDRDVERQNAAGHDDDADVEPDDVADAEQRRRKVRAHVAEIFADEAGADRVVGNHAHAALGGELDDRADRAGHRRGS